MSAAVVQRVELSERRFFRALASLRDGLEQSLPATADARIRVEALVHELEQAGNALAVESGLHGYRAAGARYGANNARVMTDWYLERDRAASS